jgi:CheY-like chemotaxis protein
MPSSKEGFPITTSRSTLRRATVLIVDDNRDVAESIGALLELSGFEVRLAHSGILALDVCTSISPNVVLVDLGMPGMNGFELARLIKQSSRYPMLMIAMTGWKRPGDDTAAHEAGFDYYLTKPVDTDAVVQVIQEFVRGRGEREARQSLEPRRDARSTESLATEASITWYLHS